LHGQSTMTNFIFLFKVYLSKGLLIILRSKHWVITKAFITLFALGNLTFVNGIKCIELPLLFFRYYFHFPL
jgi:hypothetical protein